MRSGVIYWDKWMSNSSRIPLANYVERAILTLNAFAVISYQSLVRDHFNVFEQVYAGRFQRQYGFWRMVIRTAMVKFVKCGDMKEGFARVRCPDCDKEIFVAFPYRQHCRLIPWNFGVLPDIQVLICKFQCKLGSEEMVRHNLKWRFI